MPWSWFTWSANAVPGNQRAVRLIFLVATAVTVPMAASVETAFDSGGPTFAVAGGVIMAMSIALQLTALDRDSATFRSTRGRYARDVYTWSHAPIIAGIIAGAAAVEEILLHPSDPLPSEFRTMFVVGVGLAIFGTTDAVFRAWRVVAVERIAALITIAVTAVLAGSWHGVWFLIAADIVLFVALLVEHLRVEHRGPSTS